MKFEHAPGNGIENIRWGDQTFPMGRISLSLLHGGVLTLFLNLHILRQLG